MRVHAYPYPKHRLFNSLWLGPKSLPDFMTRANRELMDSLDFLTFFWAPILFLLFLPSVSTKSIITVKIELFNTKIFVLTHKAR
jgi:hypothetical protein